MNAVNTSPPRTLVERIDWPNLFNNFPKEARILEIPAVELMRDKNAVTWRWNNPIALEYFAKNVGYFKIEGLGLHHYYARKEALDYEDLFIPLYHRLLYHDGNELVDTGRIWE